MENRQTVEKTIEKIHGIVDGVTDSVVGLTSTITPKGSDLAKSWVGFLRDKRNKFEGLLLDTVFEAGKLARETAGHAEEDKPESEAGQADEARSVEAPADEPATI